MRLFLAALVAVVTVSLDPTICFSNDQPVAPVTEQQLVAAEPIPEPARNFCDALKQAAESSDIPVAFFARLLWQESRFNSREVSHVGAQGVAQFMPGTAAEIGLENPFDPFKALPASARFLKKLQDRFGNLGLAAAAYNAGSGRIQKWLSRQGGLPSETRDYVRIITGSPAENWTEESSTVALHLELPRGAPCEGVGGLSKSTDVAAIPVVLAPSISDVIKKAMVAKSESAARDTIRIALSQNRSRISHKLAHIRGARKELASAQHVGRKTRRIVAALRSGVHPRAKVAARSRNIRLASASGR